MKRYQCVSGLFLLSFFACVPDWASAQTPAPTPTPNQPQPKAQPKPEPQEGDDPFRGLKWGVGVAFSSNLGGVGNVTVDSNKVVRVTKENSGAARGAFELHYFFKFCNDTIGKRFVYLPRSYDRTTGKLECDTNTTGHVGNDVAFGMGPFVSLNTSPFDSSGGKVFESVGVGWMVGLNAYDTRKSEATVVHTLNIGIGAILDTSVKTLAPGVVNGQTTTITDQNLLTTQSTKTGWMVMLSYKLFDINLK